MKSDSEEPDSDYEEPNYLKSQTSHVLTVTGDPSVMDGPPSKPEREIPRSEPDGKVKSYKTKISHDPSEVYNTDHR